MHSITCNIRWWIIRTTLHYAIAMQNCIGFVCRSTKNVLENNTSLTHSASWPIMRCGTDMQPEQSQYLPPVALPQNVLTPDTLKCRCSLSNLYGYQNMTRNSYRFVDYVIWFYWHLTPDPCLPLNKFILLVMKLKYYDVIKEVYIKSPFIYGY